MKEARHNHFFKEILMEDGRYLHFAIGGQYTNLLENQFSILSSCECYDFSRDTWYLKRIIYFART
jgi:hypothetical protein